MMNACRAWALSVLVALAEASSGVSCGGATATSDGGATMATRGDGSTGSGAADATVAGADSSGGQTPDGAACPYLVFGMPPLFALTPDAAPRTCAFTDADVACNADSDCAPFLIVSCGCYNLVVGVNTSNTAVCPAPPCVASPSDPCGAGSGWVTQDCNVIPETTDARLACVDHRCLTRSRLVPE